MSGGEGGEGNEVDHHGSTRTHQGNEIKNNSARSHCHYGGAGAACLSVLGGAGAERELGGVRISVCFVLLAVGMNSLA